ncbi:zinc-binding alcohol dehydrogenase family protein [Saccharomonospora xinjiangensis]|uniref:Probable alcohol dehydrogenase AdhA n=1 Tax=Saccharomonospora xinjiangensis XJ-54 TaxID=882086 RepID=I0V7K1_9PSEU|nr:zinc-binding alcohol dehydrogenase family protein [Saccharomonospora xinjiangensis]EID56104.1 zinc-binding alcohol dehydrogenase family protein [Saccharomonospora xinjiangensis XJ-54]
MRAWRVTRPGPITSGPLTKHDEPVPRPAGDELLVRVLACGVCRTDLHVAEGDLPVHRPAVVPGHEVVGEVVEAGAETDMVGKMSTAVGSGAETGRLTGNTTGERFRPGDRVGVPWLRHTCGTCRHCARGAENLCPDSRYTGWDADGGYADYATVPAGYALSLPSGYSDDELAPLLCAGIIGYRALRRAALPEGGRLGVYGFGGSAHLTTQVALAEGARVHVMTRGVKAAELATELGADSVQEASGTPPEPLDAAILFAPAGELVPAALAALDRGGTLAVAGIHLTGIPPLDYRTHLFQERQLRSVTANTRDDARAFLRFAGRHRLRVSTTPYPLDEADCALADLAAGSVVGAAVLRPDLRSRRE